MNQLVPLVVATAPALVSIATLQRSHGELIFYQSGGCCDGSTPMCFPVAEFHLGSNDRQIGQIGGVPFYVSQTQYEYWQHTQLIIDVVPGISETFSLSDPAGFSFITRSRLFTDAEWQVLLAGLAGDDLA